MREILAAHPIGSPERDRAIADFEKRTAGAERAYAWRELVAKAGSRFAGYTFETWLAKTPYQKQIKHHVQEWADNVIRGERHGLVLYGPVGTGKDHLAFAALRHIMAGTSAVVRESSEYAPLGPDRDALTAGWQNGRELAGEFRDRITDERTESGLIGRLSAPDLLVLSDPLPPVGDLTPYQADSLYRIVENRYAANKITIVTLNVANDAEADQRLGAATWDRLCDRAWKLFCQWPSYRKPAFELKPKER